MTGEKLPSGNRSSATLCLAVSAIMVNQVEGLESLVFCIERPTG